MITAMKTAREQYEIYLADGHSDIAAHLVTLHSMGYGTVLELGVRGGVSTAALLAGVEESFGMVWSVDINPACAGAFDGHPRWRFIRADSRDVKAANVAGLEPPIDTLFIDTLHTRKHVLSELDAWHEWLVPKGCILVHDAEWPGVALAIGDFIKAQAREGRTWRYELRPGSNGLGVLWR